MWIPAEKKLIAGDTLFRESIGRTDLPGGDYEMVVPDGRWIVRAEAAGLERSEPQELEVRLEPGEQRRVDFTVAGSRDSGGEWVRVRVEDVRRNRVPDAIVEVWPAAPGARGDLPIARGRTRGWIGEAGRGHDVRFHLSGRSASARANL